MVEKCEFGISFDSIRGTQTEFEKFIESNFDEFGLSTTIGSGVADVICGARIYLSNDGTKRVIVGPCLSCRLQQMFPGSKLSRRCVQGGESVETS